MINEGGVLRQGISVVRVSDGGYALKCRLGSMLLGIRLRGSCNPCNPKLFGFIHTL